MTKKSSEAQEEKKAGQVVRFAHPETKAEAAERFRVIEMRGERVLVTPTDSDMAIPPTFSYLATDLTAEEEEEGMSEEQVVECLMDLFDNEEAVRESELGEALSRRSAKTFKEAGILTRDEGLVLRMADGRELFLTVQIQEGR